MPFYTLGQRQGLGIGGIKEANNRPWYVAQKNIKDNSIIAVQGNDHPSLYSSSLKTNNSFLINKLVDGKFKGTAKIRYRQEDQECEVKKNKDSLTVKFLSPQRAITPGQSVVIYKDEVCLGGGEISQIL